MLGRQVRREEQRLVIAKATRNLVRRGDVGRNVVREYNKCYIALRHDNTAINDQTLSYQEKLASVHKL